MKNLLSDVREFHTACEIPVAQSPVEPPAGRVWLRRELIDEEVNRELLPAMARGDLPAVADGMVDAIYVIVGAALEYGLPLDRVWSAVHQANMAKVDPATGRVIRRADGKVLKPAGWQAPDIAAVLAVKPDLA